MKLTLVSDTTKERFATASKAAKFSIQRHPQVSLQAELQSLANSANINDGRDTYGVGGSLAEFEQQLSELFEKPSCLFLPTGTLAQCVAMKCYSEQTDRTLIGLHPTSHLLLHEHMAVKHLWGLHTQKMGTANRVLTVKDLRNLDGDKTAAIIIELPMREIGGELVSWSELNDIRQWCNLQQVKMHLDGARIWQTCDYYQRSLADISELFDSVYVSFYKDLGAIYGAALLGEPDFIEDAKIWARRAGGNPITLYPEVLAARHGLKKHLKKMSNYVAFAKVLSQSLSTIGLTTIPENPQASMFHISVDLSPEVLSKKIASYAENNKIVVLPLPRSGDNKHSICEITIGENAIQKGPEFWANHIEQCLGS
jgi:threonine aldolase